MSIKLLLGFAWLDVVDELPVAAVFDDSHITLGGGRAGGPHCRCFRRLNGASTFATGRFHGPAAFALRDMDCRFWRGRFGPAKGGSRDGVCTRRPGSSQNSVVTLSWR